MNALNEDDAFDREEFKEFCEGSTDKMLINLCEYELKAARGAELEEVRDCHYEMAILAYDEMERRGMV
jgi:hypothetical protein